LEFSPEDLKALDSNQKVVFLEKLASYESLPASHIRSLHDIYSFDKASAEIALRFYQLALASNSYVQEAADWVVGAKEFGTIKGRMKFCRPIFRYQMLFIIFVFSVTLHFIGTFSRWILSLQD